MAKELLPDHLLYNGKYRVIKTISFSDDGGVYDIQETATKKRFLLKEVIPPPSLKDEEVQKKIEDFTEVLLILTQFNHPNLTKIFVHFSEGRRQYVVMEKVDGVTLKTIIGMSAKPLAETQVLKWAMQICDAMHYLHDRPKPFIFDVLDSTHIMIDTEEQLRLINYGIDRFFVDKDAISFTADAELLCSEYKKLGETLVFLLTRQEATSFGVTPCDEISEPLAKVLNRLLAGDAEQNYKSFQDLQKAFDDILNPKEVNYTSAAPSQPLFKFINFQEIWDKFLMKYLRQPIWLIAAEFLVIIGGLFFVWRFFNPPIETRTESACYVACGNELDVINTASHKLVSRVKMPKPVNCLAASRDGVKLYCSSANEGLLYLVNSISNRVIRTVSVGSNPCEMQFSPSGKLLFVLQSDVGHVSIVSLNQDPLAVTAEANSKNQVDKVEAIFSIGREAYGLAATDIGNNKMRKLLAARDEESSNSEEAPAAGAADIMTYPLVFCSSSAVNALAGFVYQPPATTLSDAVLPSAGPLALSPDNSTLAMAQLSTSEIHLYKTPQLSEDGVVREVGGTAIKQVLISPDGKDLLSVNGSGTVGVINLAEKKLVNTCKLPGKPTNAFCRVVGTPEKPDYELWVTVEEPNQLLVIHPASGNIRRKVSLTGSPTSACLVAAPPVQQ